MHRLLTLVTFTMVSMASENKHGWMTHSNDDDSLKTVEYLTENITVAPGDRRQYRYVALMNKLRVLIVNDPNTTESAASLDINAGSMNDPWDLQGLAHLMTYVLPLQNQKYKKYDQFSKYVRSVGGNEVSSVRADRTIYRLEVPNAFFFTALDMFANMFISPSFSPFFVGPQMQQLDAVFKHSMANDVFIRDRMVSVLANQSHDFVKFGKGNSESLQLSAASKNLSLSSELAKFFRKFYSANLMTLSIYTRGDMDTLTGKIASIFGTLSNKMTPIPQWSSPFSNLHMGYKLHVESNEDKSVLYLFFPTPDFRPSYRVKPDYYAGYLLAREGNGSLVEYLKSKNYITDLQVQVPITPKGFQIIALSITLTETGKIHVEDLLMSIFQYIKMLEKTGPQEELYKRLEKMRENHFELQALPIRPLHYARELSKNMHLFDVEDMVSGDYLLSNFDPNSLKTLITWLNPDNFNYIIFSKDYKGKTADKEKWTGVGYSRERISRELRRRLKNAQLNPFFQFPTFY